MRPPPPFLVPSNTLHPPVLSSTQLWGCVCPSSMLRPSSVAEEWRRMCCGLGAQLPSCSTIQCFRHLCFGESELCESMCLFLIKEVILFGGFVVRLNSLLSVSHTRSDQSSVLWMLFCKQDAPTLGYFNFNKTLIFQLKYKLWKVCSDFCLQSADLINYIGLSRAWT